VDAWCEEAQRRGPGETIQAVSGTSRRMSVDPDPSSIRVPSGLESAQIGSLTAVGAASRFPWIRHRERRATR
jgi:hypothetical protein